MINYTQNLDALKPEQLKGFFVDWPNPPSAQTHLRLLRTSDYALVAIDSKNEDVVGFVTALSDGVLSVYVSFLEVIPAYQGSGIGTELMRRLLELTQDLYAVDLLCDPDLQPFYERLGMRRAGGMFIRNYDKQAGE